MKNINNVGLKAPLNYMAEKEKENAILNKYAELVIYEGYNLLKQSLRYDTIKELEDYIKELKNGYYVTGIYKAFEIYNMYYFDIKGIIELYLELGGEVENKTLLDIEKVVNLAYKLMGSILRNLLEEAKQESEENEY